MSADWVDPDATTVPWGQLLREATSRLGQADVEDPALDARRIVEQAAGLEPGELRRSLERAATRRAVARFDSMLARREAGEPLQYVVGRWGFRTLDLHVDRRVLIPRPETEVVAGIAVTEAAQRADRDESVVVADLGTGSGAIGLAVAVECSTATVLATDRSDAALAVARANLAGLGRAATRVSLHEGRWFEALPASARGTLDVVVTNPPYIADDEDLPEVVARWEPVEALRAGPTGTEDLEVLIDEVGDWLRADGVFVTELAPHQADAMSDRARRRGYQVSVHPDLADRDRVLVARP